MEIIEKKQRNYFELEDIETFLRINEYPTTIKEKGARSNFKRDCKNFSIENGPFLYKRQPVGSYGKTTTSRNNQRRS